MNMFLSSEHRTCVAEYSMSSWQNWILCSCCINNLTSNPPTTTPRYSQTPPSHLHVFWCFVFFLFGLCMCVFNPLNPINPVAGCWLVLLTTSWAGNHSSSMFLSATAMSSPEDSISQRSPPSFVVCILSGLFHNVPWASWGWVAIEVPFRAKHLSSLICHTLTH